MYLTRLLLLASITFFVNLSIAQQFTAVTDGAVVNTPGDSRSANFLDVNKDGLDDLFFSNGPSTGQNNELYLNNGDGTFIKVANDPIVMDLGKSDGASFADSDNDGNMDVYVVTWYGSKNFYYRSDDNNAFTYESALLSGSTTSYSETTSWGDYDHDGLVDIYVTNSDGNKRNWLYHNMGNGNFEAVGGVPMVTDTDLSRCVNWVDYNNDGAIDLFVSNESNTANDLYQNDGQGNFTKVASGAIVQNARSSMSSSWGDVNNDGFMDLFVANAGFYQEQNNQLFINNGDGTFELRSNDVLSQDGGCSYGSAFGDYNNDGYLDLLVANGFCNSNLQDYLYLNDGTGNFTRDQNSANAFPVRCSFGAAWGDYNDDGFLDLAVAHCKNTNASPQPNNSLFLNEGNDNNWIKVRLQGIVSNASAIGAVVRIKATIDGEEVWQMRDVNGQSGYCGQNSLTLHFGLGDAQQVDSLLIHWPSGINMALTNQSADTTLFIVEDITNSTSLNAAKEIGLTISPNPSRDYLQIQAQLPSIHASKVYQLTIIDSLGRPILQQRKQLAASGTINEHIGIQHIPPGTYHLTIQTSVYLASQSFVIH